MKTIPNTITEIKDGERALTHADLLVSCLNQTPEGGFTFETIRARLRVAAIVEKVKDAPEIQLEDADFATAVSCIRAKRWGGMHPDLIKFAEAFGL